MRSATSTSGTSSQPWAESSPPSQLSGPRYPPAGARFLPPACASPVDTPGNFPVLRTLAAGAGGDVSVNGADFADQAQGRLGRRPEKAVVLVKPGGVIVDGVDHEVAGSDSTRRGHDALVGVEQQLPTEAAAVQAPIQRQLAEQHRRYTL